MPSAIALTARSSNALIMSEMRGHTGHFAEPSIWTASVELERTRVGFSIRDCGTAVGQGTRRLPPYALLPPAANGFFCLADAGASLGETASAVFSAGWKYLASSLPNLRLLFPFFTTLFG